MRPHEKTQAPKPLRAAEAPGGNLLSSEEEGLNVEQKDHILSTNETGSDGSEHQAELLIRGGARSLMSLDAAINTSKSLDFDQTEDLWEGIVAIAKALTRADY